MVVVYEFDSTEIRWKRVAIFSLEADADFYIMMRRRYTKNIRIRKDAIYNA